METDSRRTRIRANQALTRIGRALVRAPRTESAVTTLFHRMYYGQPKRTWENTTWLGMKIMKCPTDLWMYQELLERVRPDVVLETGTFTGASAHYLASICDLLGKGRIVTVDNQSWPDVPEPPAHPRITYLVGSSTSPEIMGRMREAAEGTVMVILDSDHSRDHVLAELELYAPLVGPGSYVIVEDTNVHGHPAAPNHPAGPMEAVDEFLRDHHEFRIDPDCEKFFMTFNPRGYLRRH